MPKTYTAPSLPVGYHWLRKGSKLNHGDIKWEDFKGSRGWRGQRYVGEPWNVAKDQYASRPSYYARPDDRKKLKKLPSCSFCHKSEKLQGTGYGDSAVITILLHDNGSGLVCGGCLGNVTRHYNLIRRFGHTPSINGIPCTLKQAQKQIKS